MQPVRRSKALEGLRLSTAAHHLSTDAHSQSLQPSGSSQFVYACRQQVQDLSTDKRKTHYGKFCKLPNLVFLWSMTLHMLTLIYKQPFATNLVHKQPPSKNPKEFSQEALFCCSASTYRLEPRTEDFWSGRWSSDVLDSSIYINIWSQSRSLDSRRTFRGRVCLLDLFFNSRTLPCSFYSILVCVCGVSSGCCAWYMCVCVNLIVGSHQINTCVSCSSWTSS